MLAILMRLQVSYTVVEICFSLKTNKLLTLFTIHMPIQILCQTFEMCSLVLFLNMKSSLYILDIGIL